GFKQHPVALSLRDYTLFQSPISPLRYTVAPMGTHNMPGTMQDNINFIFQDEIPHLTTPFIDGIGVR
ncbi:hypothetical protein DACRYDRAFT_30081, partial [Dacryopinax primogenitus]